MKSNIKIFMAMVVLLCGIGLTACDKNTPNLEQAKSRIIAVYSPLVPF